MEKMKNFEILQNPRFLDGNVAQAKLYTFYKDTKVEDHSN